MLRSVRELEKFKLITADGQPCGRIKDVYFKDQTWRLQHLVATLDPRYHGPKQILLDPAALDTFRDDEDTIVLKTHSEDLTHAPSATSILPVCKQYASLALSSPGAGFAARSLAGSDPHLRSARAVLNYRLHLLGEFAGTLTDFLFDPAEVEIRYLAVEQITDRQKIQFHVAATAVERFTWATQRVHLKHLQPVVLAPGIMLPFPAPAVLVA